MLPARRAPAGVRQTAVPAGAFARPGKALPRRLLPGRIGRNGAQRARQKTAHAFLCLPAPKIIFPARRGNRPGIGHRFVFRQALLYAAASKAKRPLLRALGSAVCGAASLGAVNLLAGYTGVSIALNYATAFVAVVLGAPGVVTMLLLRVLLLF